MGLRETLQTAAKTAVKATGNIAVSTNYHSFSSTTINVSSGSPTTTYSTTAGVSVVFEAFRLAEVDGESIKPEDKKALIPAKNISGVTPGVNDQIIETSTTWEVQNVQVDPANALWMLHIRKP